MFSGLDEANEIEKNTPVTLKTYTYADMREAWVAGVRQGIYYSNLSDEDKKKEQPRDFPDFRTWIENLVEHR